MFLNRYKVIGILGGMGPEATIDLYNNIIKLTPATKDQDHIPVLIFSNPKVPDRTANVLAKDVRELEKIVKYLQEGARILENGGADFIVMPCNTAHKFFTEIQSAVNIPLVHMIRETALYLVEEHSRVKNVGLLATSGTLHTNLYQEQLNQHGIEAIIPDEHIQNEFVMPAIYGIKAGKNRDTSRLLLTEALKSFERSAQKVVIMGCTEIPLAFPDPIDGIALINPTQVLAESAVKKSLGS